MLVLTRKNQESVVVGGAGGFQGLLKVTVLGIKGTNVRLGFDVAPDIPVHRSEVWERISGNGQAEARPENRRRRLSEAVVTAAEASRPRTGNKNSSEREPIMSSVDQLVERLAAEVAAATERVHALQTEAARVFLGREQKFMRFITLAEQIEAILQPRIEAFTKVNVFQDIKQSVSLELRGPEGRGFHGRTITLSVPASDACSAKVVLSFRLGHDGPLENALLDYHLEILPIFIKFDSHDQLVIPIDSPDEGAITAWIDEKLVGFTRTYFEMYFTEQYQKQSFEMDPVMNVLFPRAFAAGTKDYQGRTFHFYTKESLQAFEKTPSEYIATA